MKNHIFFFEMFWKDDRSKKIALEYDLPCIIRKDGVYFLQKYDIILQAENERWSFSKKIHWNMIYSSNVPKRWSFQTNCTGIWSFLYHEERWHFFFPKILYFFTDEKWKVIFLKKYMEIWCFLYVGKVGISFSTGITKKEDIHPRRYSSWHSLYFYGDLFKSFHTLLSNKKNSGNLNYRVENWLHL